MCRVNLVVGAEHDKGAWFFFFPKINTAGVRVDSLDSERPCTTDLAKFVTAEFCLTFE